MDFVTINYRLLLALLIGIAIGLEREINEKNTDYEKQPTALLGIRTFSLVSILGAITGLLYPSFLPVALLVSGAFFILLIVFYILDVSLAKDPGITTETALMYSFIIGMLLTLNVIPIQVTLAITVVILLLLSQKEFIKTTVRSVTRYELHAFIAFLIIALVILPFLPNASYSLRDIPGISSVVTASGISGTVATIDLVNPFRIWLYVALITGIDFIGYVLERVIGNKKGWLFTSIAGGFISSTATTESLAQESKTSGRVHHLLSAAVIANVVSFIQIALLIISLNIHFFVQLIPILGFMIAGGLISFVYFIRKHDAKSSKKLDADRQKKPTEIINVKSALTFVGIFLLISILSKLALALFGQGGFLLTTALGALVGLDAVMINTSQLVGKTISFPLALQAFILANAVNLLAKSFYGYILGAKEFAMKFALGMVFVIIASMLGYFIAL